MQKHADVYKVSFELENRKLTAEQVEAGKQLFARLIERAESNIKKDKGCKDA